MHMNDRGRHPCAAREALPLAACGNVFCCSVRDESICFCSRCRYVHSSDWQQEQISLSVWRASDTNVQSEDQCALYDRRLQSRRSVVTWVAHWYDRDMHSSVRGEHPVRTYPSGDHLACSSLSRLFEKRECLARVAGGLPTETAIDFVCAHCYTLSYVVFIDQPWYTLFSGKMQKRETLTLHDHPAPLRLFFSYADEDLAFVDTLIQQCGSMIREKSIQCSSRHLLLPGSEWQAQLRAYLLDADIILLLVSSHFNASDACYYEEVVPAMAQHSSGKARAIPIILRPVEWKHCIFGKLFRLPRGKAVSMWSKRDDALAHITRGVKEVIDDLRGMARNALQRTEKPVSLWTVPYWRNPFFTGREDVLLALQRALNLAHGSPRIQALSGLVGVGKTQVATEYAYRHASTYQAALWVHADSAETLLSGFVALAETLDIPERMEANQPLIIKAVKLWFVN